MTCWSSHVIYNVNWRSAWRATLSSLRWARNLFFLFFFLPIPWSSSYPASRKSCAIARTIFKLHPCIPCGLFTKIPRSIAFPTYYVTREEASEKRGWGGEKAFCFFTPKRKVTHTTNYRFYFSSCTRCILSVKHDLSLSGTRHFLKKRRKKQTSCPIVICFSVMMAPSDYKWASSYVVVFLFCVELREDELALRGVCGMKAKSNVPRAKTRWITGRSPVERAKHFYF